MGSKGRPESLSPPSMLLALPAQSPDVVDSRCGTEDPGSPRYKKLLAHPSFTSIRLHSCQTLADLSGAECSTKPEPRTKKRTPTVANLHQLRS